MKEDPPLSFKCKDKFLVQSTMIPDEKDHLNANDFWASVAGDDHIKLNQQKLRVVYLPAEGALQEEDEHDLNQASIMTEGDSTLHRYQTVKQHNGHAADAPGIGIPVFDNEPRNSLGAGSGNQPRAHTPDGAEFANAHEQQSHEEHEPVAISVPTPIISPSSTAQVGVGSMSTTIPRVSYDHSAEYAAKLAEANAEIARLQALLANSNTQGIRRRPVFSDDGTSVQDGVTDAGLDDSASVIGTVTRPDGVPLNVVAMVSVLVFVITYLFF
ncbi:hypothetical protein PIIN_06934 [Serendipita indica DSM 11827]|uniref:MSP domain-containing protein n=1 Tax=Serendipita indica (strain DSM 11827) TaxID=1109443 RepID=G4TNT6_SERID|nr:hypothetical protein PIIN_06934 [Serendipita indica DSM 11827]